MKEKILSLAKPALNIVIAVSIATASFQLGCFYYYTKSKEAVVENPHAHAYSPEEISIAVNESNELIMIERATGKYIVYSDEIGQTIFGMYANRIHQAATITATTPDNTEIRVARVPGSINQGSPPCIQMYNYIKAYADTFNIPLRYAFGIANTETSYNGPFHWKYNPAQTSCAGAVGPMQVMVSTARWINKDNISKERLRTDIKYNVYTSMKLLHKLFIKNKDWKLAFGEYNTGRPCVNGYAHKVYNYEPTW